MRISGTGCGRKAVGFAAAVFAAARLCAFDGGLLLTPPELRGRVVSALTAAGESADAEVLEAVWSGDGARFAAAARASLAVRFDRQLARRLLERLEADGDEEGAAALRRRLASARRGAVPCAASAHGYRLSGRRPVVFLHGYGGDETTWSDFVDTFRTAGYGEDDLLVFRYYDDRGAAGAADGLDALDLSVSKTPIEEIAAKVAERTRVWLRRRAGYADDDGSHDAEIPPPDWICHSMGGLVLRCVLAEQPDLVHRGVDLATPHFGQNVAVDVASAQMKYGSSFLWRLAEDWFFRGRSTEDMIFIAGVASHDPSANDVMWDGLVCSFSATPLTLADGADYSNRTFFVNRVHTTAYEAVFDNLAILDLAGGTNDPVFRLAYGYLNDCGPFADGRVPTLRETLLEDGASPTRVGKVEEKTTGFGGLFVQAVEPVTNSAARLAKALPYDPGVLWADPVVSSLSNRMSHAVYGAFGSDCFFEHGDGDEGCTNGLVFVFGNIPCGEYVGRVEKPSKTETPYVFPFFPGFTVPGGGIAVARIRPGAAVPASAFALPDGSGGVFTETVPNAWFAGRGLVASPEDLAGCVAAGEATGANGISVAASHWLDLDPADPGSTLAFSSVGTAGDLALGVRLGNRPLAPGGGSAAGGARFVLQSKDPDAAEWSDEPVGPSADGLWHVSVRGAARLYRLTARRPRE